MVESGRRPSVEALDESKRLPLLVRWRLRKEQHRRRTGVLLYAEIREPLRSLTYKAGVVSLWENGVELCSRSRDTKMPKFVELPPGAHTFEFKVIRVRAGKSSSFQKVVDLDEGEILVAVCDPVQSNVFYRRSPDADTWVVGVLTP
ncbi:hypothetical protein [Streptomyces sp. KM273126]|uniref:hypothetical protein n=1 Tax=Streptomyces sp. KM273126 TaxID=2545247 RepID=UPI00215D90AC|nr:hypothetical protein [Streptomyces sp. KM273126]